MKAKIKNPQQRFTDSQLSYRGKPLARQISVIDRDTGREIVCARFYQSGSVAFCLLWARNTLDWKRSTQGAGRAGGYGYHKQSAALDSAISAAGIELSESIHGVGDSAIDDALRAIARAMTGKPKFYLVRAHA